MRDRYLGCLLGLACGDALGGPVEFDSRQTIRDKHPNGFRDFVGGGWLHLFPGEITDDTQMAMMLAESLVAHPDLDMGDLTARFVAWLHSDPKDIGNTTRASLHRLADGEDWQTAGEAVRIIGGDRAAGNGSVMRSAPVAMRFRNEPERLRTASIDTARITHADRRCTAAAVAVNQAIVFLLSGGDKSGVVEAAVAGSDDHETRAAVLGAAALAEADVRSGGYVLDTTSAAFWAYLNNESYEEAVIAAVALGADTDTTAAVAGAIAGAHYGVAAIPARWLDLVQHRERLTELASRLYNLSEGISA